MIVSMEQHTKRKFLTSTAILLILVNDGRSTKFSIDAQVDQIFRIIEKTHTAIETSDMKMTMTPADFNFLIPFTVRMTCSDGSMVPQDMRRVHQEDIYMEAINGNETFIEARFTVAEMDFRYDICWLSLVIPVPMWLRGKILQSTYHVTAKVTYEPTCEFTMIKSSLESYEKISLNVFNWLPGGLGDVMTEMLTRNTQDRIHETVSKSIEKTMMKLSTIYDPCVAFPAMGRLTEIAKNEEELEDSVIPMDVSKRDDSKSSEEYNFVGERQHSKSNGENTKNDHQMSDADEDTSRHDEICEEWQPNDSTMSPQSCTSNTKKPPASELYILIRDQILAEEREEMERLMINNRDS